MESDPDRVPGSATGETSPRSRGALTGEVGGSAAGRRRAAIARGGRARAHGHGGARRWGAELLRPAGAEGAGVGVGDPGLLLHRRARRCLGRARRHRQIAGGRGIAALVRRSRLVAAGGAAASAGLLVMDLGRPPRFLAMLRVFRPSSPMNMGAWLLAGFGGLSAAAALPAPAGRAPGATDAAALGAAVLGLPLVGYTGVLLANTAVPVWQETRNTLPILFAFSGAVSAGGLSTSGAHPAPGGEMARRFGLVAKGAELALSRALHREAGAVPQVERTLRRGRGGALLRAARAMLGASALLDFLPGPSRARCAALGSAGPRRDAGAPLRRGGQPGGPRRGTRRRPSRCSGPGAGPPSWLRAGRAPRCRRLPGVDATGKEQAEHMEQPLPRAAAAPGRLEPARAAPSRTPRAGSIRYLRLSLTDRCNFRCTYCSPADARAAGRAALARRAGPPVPGLRGRWACAGSGSPAASRRSARTWWRSCATRPHARRRGRRAHHERPPPRRAGRSAPRRGAGRAQRLARHARPARLARRLRQGRAARPDPRRHRRARRPLPLAEAQHGGAARRERGRARRARPLRLGPRSAPALHRADAVRGRRGRCRSPRCARCSPREGFALAPDGWRGWGPARHMRGARPRRAGGAGRLHRRDDGELLRGLQPGPGGGRRRVPGVPRRAPEREPCGI